MILSQEIKLSTTVVGRLGRVAVDKLVLRVVLPVFGDNRKY